LHNPKNDKVGTSFI